MQRDPLKKPLTTFARGPFLAMALLVAAWMPSLVVTPVLAEPRDESAPAKVARTWTDAEIHEVLQLGCQRSHRVERYRGRYRKEGMIGPLWLRDPDDSRAAGVLLPTFLRLYLYASDRGCRHLDLAEARPLASPDVWVVLWRTEDPHRPFTYGTSSDQVVMRPTAVQVGYQGSRSQPVTTRHEDEWLRRWFEQDWDDRESLVATFREVPKGAYVSADYDVEGSCRHCRTETKGFSLLLIPEDWWAFAHGMPVEEGELR